MSAVFRTGRIVLALWLRDASFTVSNWVGEILVLGHLALTCYAIEILGWWWGILTLLTPAAAEIYWAIRAWKVRPEYAISLIGACILFIVLRFVVPLLAYFVMSKEDRQALTS